jgi:hypothetical protein
MGGWRHLKVGAEKEYSQLHAVHARLEEETNHMAQ